jgi:hypothetical protein
MPKPKRARRTRQRADDHRIRVWSEDHDPIDTRRLAEALLLNASAQAAHVHGEERPHLAGVHKLSELSKGNAAKEDRDVS